MLGVYLTAFSNDIINNLLYCNKYKGRFWSFGDKFQFVVLKFHLWPELTGEFICVTNDLLHAEHLALSCLPLHWNIITLFHVFSDEPTDKMLRLADTEIDANLFYRIDRRTGHRRKRRKTFYVMEFHPTSLADYARVKGNNLSLREILHLAVQLGDALTHL